VEAVKDSEGNKDPIYDEFQFCETCEPKVHQLILYIRNLENAQVVAKEALESMNLLNAKLTKTKELIEDERNDLREKLNKKKEMDLKNKMRQLDDAHNRFVNRGKFG